MKKIIIALSLFSAHVLAAEVARPIRNLRLENSADGGGVTITNIGGVTLATGATLAGAVQRGDSITNLTGYGTAALANVGDFATSAQGAKADGALQAADYANGSGVLNTNLVDAAMFALDANYAAEAWKLYNSDGGVAVEANDLVLKSSGTASNLTATGTTTHRGSSEWRDTGNTLRASINHTTGAVMIRGLDSNELYQRELVSSMQFSGWTFSISPEEFFWAARMPTNVVATQGARCFLHVPQNKNVMTVRTVWSSKTTTQDTPVRFAFTSLTNAASTNAASKFYDAAPFALTFTGRVANAAGLAFFAQTNTFNLVTLGLVPDQLVGSISLSVQNTTTQTNSNFIYLNSLKVSFD